jgi:hypothetical protein
MLNNIRNNASGDMVNIAKHMEYEAVTPCICGRDIFIETPLRLTNPSDFIIKKRKQKQK